MAATTDHIELRPSRSGSLRAFIAGTRVRVQDIHALAEIQGRTADQIVAALPELTLGKVHAALSYYFDHRQEILDEIRADETLVAKVREATGPGPLEAKLDSPEARP